MGGTQLNRIPSIGITSSRRAAQLARCTHSINAFVMDGTVATVGVFNTVIDRYKLDVRWFSAFLFVMVAD